MDKWVVTSCPSGSEQPYDSAVRFPVFPACAVTQVMNRAELKGADGEVETTLPCLPEFPLSVSHSELHSEQRVDPSLDDLFGLVLSASVVKNVASGYFFQDDILVRNRVSHGEDYVGDPMSWMGTGKRDCHGCFWLHKKVHDLAQTI